MFWNNSSKELPICSELSHYLLTDIMKPKERLLMKPKKQTETEQGKYGRKIKI